MKKLFIAALLFIAAATANAATTNDNSRIAAFFKAAYPGATNVHYKTVEEMVSVSFVLEGAQMQAFYNKDGERLAISKVVELKSLPLKAQTAIGKKYADYAVTEVIEMDYATEGTSYYVSLLGDNQKVVIVRATTEGELSIFKKTAR